MFGPDELAGMVDTFGALERSELERACSETAFRRGEEFDEDAVARAIDDAIEAYALVEHEGRLVPGPAAFPTLPDGAEDLPHILDVERREVDREAVAVTVADRFAADVDAAIESGDRAACETLLDRSYEVESWGPVELDEERQRLDEKLTGDDDPGEDDPRGTGESLEDATVETGGEPSDDPSE
jgi:hypothetical protein